MLFLIVYRATGKKRQGALPAYFTKAFSKALVGLLRCLRPVTQFFNGIVRGFQYRLLLLN